jgi:hypothetical protein
MAHWQTWALLDRLRTERFAVTGNGDCFRVEPGSRLTDDLSSEVRARKADLLEWAEAEQAEYDTTLGEMARVLDDSDLVAWLEQRFGTRLAVENGRLRAENAAVVPATVRAVVRARQRRLVECLRRRVQDRQAAIVRYLREEALTA